jgi:hypothetical protein
MVTAAQTGLLQRAAKIGKLASSSPAALLKQAGKPAREEDPVPILITGPFSDEGSMP